MDGWDLEVLGSLPDHKAEAELGIGQKNSTIGPQTGGLNPRAVLYPPHPPQYLIKDLAVWVRIPALVTHCVSLGKAPL